MKRTSRRSILALLTLFSFAIPAPAAPKDDTRFSFAGIWRIQSSCTDKSSGEQISTPGFSAANWHKAELPGTVVGALVEDKTLPERNYAINLKSFAGVSLGGDEPFANRDMPADSPYRCSHWFRMEFETPRHFSGREAWLQFHGINYRANIWFNGKKIAGREDIAGAMRTYDFLVTDSIDNKDLALNALAVEVFAPEKNDLGLTWVDWNPTPPDKDMGIWREINFETTGDVAIRNPFVSSKLDAAYKSAALTLSAELRNATANPVKAVLHADFENTHLSQPVELAANETKLVRFAPEQFAQLKVAAPRLWWPYQMGEPFLYTAKFRVELGKEISDTASATFGIREITSELTDRGHRLFKVNGKPVLIRGAAWAPDMLYRWNSSRLDADLAYVKDMGLNTIRLEGKMDREEFFDKTDRLGILVMPGWTCCDAWERWKDWTAETKKIAAASMNDEGKRLRNHASVFVWFYGSDGPPPADIEKMYLGILNDIGWPNPAVSSASETPTSVTGKSGVKMTGPYEYVPPMYWLNDKEAGGAFGYNTETSPGPAIPPKESLAKFIPKEHLWPIDDFERKAQAMAYDNQRSMFEAYGRNKYVSTGVIQWMLNNAWPSLIWHLYDYYLVPAGGYFGTKKACEPVHVQYSYDDNSIAVINGTYESIKGARVSAKIYSIDAKEKGSREATLDLAADNSIKAFDLPTPEGLTPTYFLKLELHDAAGKLLSDNFYWLSTKPDVLDWAKRTDTVYTPQKEFGDLTGLNNLPIAKVAITRGLDFSGRNPSFIVIAENKSDSVAFMVHPRLTRGKGGGDVM